MRLFAAYLGSEYWQNSFGTLKQLTVMSLLVAFITILIGIWPGIVYKDTANYQFAGYDLHLNGPMSPSAVEAIINELPEGATTLGTLSSAANVEVDGATARVQATYYDSSNKEALSMGFVNSAIFVAGDFSSNLPILADVTTATEMGVAVGDKFVIHEPGATGSKGVSRTVTLSGTIAPTTRVSGLYLPADLSGSSLGAVEEVDTPLYSDLFIQANPDSPADINRIMGGEETGDLVGYTREQELQSALAEVERSVPKTIRDGLIAVGLLVMLAYLYREHSVRLDHRKRQLAVLSSLGMSRARILRFFGVEQILLAIIPITLGSIIGLSYLESVGIWLPKLTAYGVIGTVTGGFMITMGISLLGLYTRLARTDMARLLSAE